MTITNKATLNFIIMSIRLDTNLEYNILCKQQDYICEDTSSTYVLIMCIYKTEKNNINIYLYTTSHCHMNLPNFCIRF